MCDVSDGQVGGRGQNEGGGMMQSRRGGRSEIRGPGQPAALRPAGVVTLHSRHRVRGAPHPVLCCRGSSSFFFLRRRRRRRAWHDAFWARSSASGCSASSGRGLRRARGARECRRGGRDRGTRLRMTVDAVCFVFVRRRCCRRVRRSRCRRNRVRCCARRSLQRVGARKEEQVCHAIVCARRDRAVELADGRRRRRCAGRRADVPIRVVNVQPLLAVLPQDVDGVVAARREAAVMIHN